MTPLHDLLHLSYNLLYPAILGTFIYDMALGGIANGAFVSAVWAKKIVVLMLYTMDFTVAKKIYAHHAKNFDLVKLSTAVAAELLTLATLWCSYWKAKDPGSFFYWSMLVFIFAGGLVHFVVTKGRPINNNKIFNSILFGSAGLMVALAVKPEFFYEPIIPWILMTLIAAYYLLVIKNDDIVMRHMLVSSELILPKKPPRRRTRFKKKA